MASRAELVFICKELGIDNNGMNPEEMVEVIKEEADRQLIRRSRVSIKYSADWVLEMFGYEKLYNIRFEDTFDFMTKQSITDTFTDFFRGEEVNYKEVK